MLSAEANVATDRASRYLVQLCQHVEHLHQRGVSHNGGGGPAKDAKVEWSETEGSIDVGWARCALRATGDTLMLRVEAPDEASLNRFQGLIGGRVTKIGRRDDLAVEWTRPSATRPGPEPPDRGVERPADRSAGVPRWVKVLGVIAVVVVILVIIMLLGGHNPGRHGS